MVFVETATSALLGTSPLGCLADVLKESFVAAGFMPAELGLRIKSAPIKGAATKSGKRPTK
jgi:hypothetical protein